MPNLKLTAKQQQQPANGVLDNVTTKENKVS